MTHRRPEQIDAAAKYLAETVMRYKWEGLREDGRSADAGFPAWKIGGHANARMEDYRDAVRSILATADGEASDKK